MKTLARFTFWGAVFSFLAVSASAQDFYDDDIYGGSSARKAAARKQQRTAAARAVVTDFAPADAYAGVATSGSTRNVDEYNRRGSYTPVSQQVSPLVDSLGNNFEYTRRLERFYGSDVVSRSDDPDVEYLYNYSDGELAQAVGSQSPAEVNIYVGNVVDPWDMFSPYFYSSAWSWAFVPGYANPWWGYNYWGPSWNWSWGWGPTWSWGPSWSWGWGGGYYPPHHHHPAPGPSWSHAGRPGAAPGAYRPANRPVGSLTQRPSSVGRPGRSSGTFTRRPSQSGVSGREPGSVTSNDGGFTRRPYNPSDANRLGSASTNSGTRRSSATGSRSTSGRASSSWGVQSSGSNRSSSSSGSYNRSSGSSSSGRSSSSGYNRSSSSGSYNRSSGSSSSGRSSSSGSRSTSGGSRGRR